MGILWNHNLSQLTLLFGAVYVILAVRPPAHRPPAHEKDATADLDFLEKVEKSLLQELDEKAKPVAPQQDNVSTADHEDEDIDGQSIKMLRLKNSKHKRALEERVQHLKKLLKKLKLYKKGLQLSHIEDRIADAVSELNNITVGAHEGTADLMSNGTADFASGEQEGTADVARGATADDGNGNSSANGSGNATPDENATLDENSGNATLDEDDKKSATLDEEDEEEIDARKIKHGSSSCFKAQGAMMMMLLIHALRLLAAW
jgi:hypothetical protein